MAQFHFDLKIANDINGEEKDLKKNLIILCWNFQWF